MSRVAVAVGSFVVALVLKLKVSRGALPETGLRPLCPPSQGTLREAACILSSSLYPTVNGAFHV